jgi:hypothetical protein
VLGVVCGVTGLAWIATLLGFAQVYVTSAALLLVTVGIVFAIARAREQALP